MTAARRTSSSAPIWPPAKRRRRSCPRRRGRPRRAPATGRWLAAPWRPVLILRRLNWRRRGGSPASQFVGWAKALKRRATNCHVVRSWRAPRSSCHRARIRATRWLCPPYCSYGAFFANISFAAIRPPPAISTAAIAIFALGFGKAGQNQKRGREQRRRVGGGAEHADIAALHSDIPGIERGADRADAERCDRQPLQERLGPHRGLDRAMHQCREQRGRETKARHRIGRHAT